MPFFLAKKSAFFPVYTAVLRGNIPAVELKSTKKLTGLLKRLIFFEGFFCFVACFREIFFCRIALFFKHYIALHCIMENICLRLDKSLVRELEICMKEFKYSTKTELIRDALRDKLKKLAAERKKKKAWDALFAARGIFKDQAMTDEEFYKKREEFSEKLEKEFREKYNVK